jgi:hypothetical protein
MPEQHGKHTRQTEDQRKSEKIPLLAEKVDVRVAKKFHASSSPFPVISKAAHPSAAPAFCPPR